MTLTTQFTTKLDIVKDVLFVNGSFAYVANRNNKDGAQLSVPYRKGPETPVLYQNSVSSAYFDNTEASTATFDAYVTFHKLFDDKHDFTAMVGYNQENWRESYEYAQRKDLITDGLPTPNLATGDMTVTQRVRDLSFRSVFGRLNYTYDNRYIETLWWLLKQLYKKGLLYKGYTIQPYSPAAGTGLSSHELNQPGCYRDVKDTTVVAQFKMKNPKPEMTEWGTPYFIAWTTTPWTLPSNTALCVGPKIDYVAVQSYNAYTGEPITVVLAKALLNALFNPKAADLKLEDYKAGDKLVPFKVIAEYKGTDLIGMEYEQLIPWVKPVEVSEDGDWKASNKAFRVIPGDYVTTEDGTGIVHIAPTFGADDANVARAAGIPSLFMINKRGETRPMVDLTGKFYLLDELDENFVKECVDVEKYKEYQGAWVKNAYNPVFMIDGKYDEKAAQAAESLDIVLAMMMKANNQAFKIEKHVHNYPHCWRTDKPVLYYPLDSWFIRSTACKERMMELNKTINWKPYSATYLAYGRRYR